MLQRNKAAYAEGEGKVAKLKTEHDQLAETMKALELELRLWRGRNAELRSKLNYAVQITF